MCTVKYKIGPIVKCVIIHSVHNNAFIIIIIIIIIVIIIIITYHDFLPPPRRGSHVKSGNTHTVIKVHPLAHILDT